MLRKSSGSSGQSRALASSSARRLLPEGAPLLSLIKNAVGVNYDFSGNVRVSEKIIERGVALTNGTYPAETQHQDVRKKGGKILYLEEQEENYIKWVLGEIGGYKKRAARILGIESGIALGKAQHMGWTRKYGSIVPLIESSQAAPSSFCSPASARRTSLPFLW